LRNFSLFSFSIPFILHHQTSHLFSSIPGGEYFLIRCSSQFPPPRFPLFCAVLALFSYRRTSLFLAVTSNFAAHPPLLLPRCRGFPCLTHDRSENNDIPSGMGFSPFQTPPPFVPRHYVRFHVRHCRTSQLVRFPFPRPSGRISVPPNLVLLCFLLSQLYSMLGCTAGPRDCMPAWLPRCQKLNVLFFDTPIFPLNTPKNRRVSRFFAFLYLFRQLERQFVTGDLGLFP